MDYLGCCIFEGSKFAEGVVEKFIENRMKKKECRTSVILT